MKFRFKEAWILGDGDPATTSCLYQCEMFLILDLIGGAQLQLSQLPQLSLALPWFLQTDIFTLGTVRLRSFLNISSIIKSDLTCWISTIVISNIQNFHCPVIVVCNYLSTILNNLSIKSNQNICLSHHKICCRR